MWNHVTSCKIYKTFLSFKRYVRTYRSIVRVAFMGMEHGYYRHTPEEYLAHRKFLLADARFFSMLTIKERTAIEAMVDDYDLKKYDNEYLRSAYAKYLQVFFDEQIVRGFIDKVILGILLETIRKKSKMSKIELSKTIKVSTRTIQRIEKGEILPTIEFLFLFCRIFDRSMDELLSYSAVEK